MVANRDWLNNMSRVKKKKRQRKKIREKKTYMALPCELTSILACTLKLIIQIASNLSTERTSAVEIIIVSGKMGEGLRFWVSHLRGKEQILVGQKEGQSFMRLFNNE